MHRASCEQAEAEHLVDDAAVRPGENADRAGIRTQVVLTGRAGDEVGHSIAIHVADARDRMAEAAAGLEARDVEDHVLGGEGRSEYDEKEESQHGGCSHRKLRSAPG